MLQNALSSESLPNRIDTRKQEIQQRDEARVVRGQGRADRGQRIAKALSGIREQRGPAIMDASEQYYDQKRELVAQAKELERLGKPITKEEMDARLHEIKKGVGGRARELAAERRALRPAVTELEAEIATDEKPEDINWEERGGIHAAKAELGRRPTKQSYDVATRAAKRLREAELRAEFLLALNEDAERVTDIEQQYEPDKLALEEGADTIIANLETDPAVDMLKEQTAKIIDPMIKRIASLKRNIDLCTNPQIEGFLFLKAPILFNNRGEKYKVTSDKLSEYKPGFENELQLVEYKVTEALSRLQESISSLAHAQLRSLISEKLVKLRTVLSIGDVSRDNVTQSQDVYDEIAGLSDGRIGLVRRKDAIRTRYDELSTKINKKVRNGADNIVKKWYSERSSEIQA